MLQTLLMGSGDATMFPDLLTIDCLHYAKNKEHVLHNTVFFLKDDGQFSSTWMDTARRHLKIVVSVRGSSLLLPR